jgi:GNAT superfamily N-acetyltransferase
LATLRLATELDIPAMHRVRLSVRENRLSNPARITTADYVAAMDDLGRSWLIEADDQVVAFGTGYRDGSVWALFVHPEHEGHGYGRTLHATVVDWLWSLGHPRLWLTTGPATRAERFYVAQGWQPCGLEAGGDLRLELCRPDAPPGACQPSTGSP